MLDTAKAIAEFLGSEWTAVDGFWENGRDAILAHKDGIRRLHVQTNWQDKAKLHIGGMLPDGKEWRERVPYDMKTDWSINVANSKTPEKMAGDITRRLLPDYNRDMTIIEERYRDNRQREAIRGAMLRTIVEAFGQDVDTTDTDREGASELGRYGDDVRGSVKLPYPDADGTFPYGVDFKITVPAEHAARVARFLKTLV